MKLDRDRLLELAHFWATNAMFFALGYMALSYLRSAFIVSFFVLFVASIVKVITSSILDKPRTVEELDDTDQKSQERPNH